jgi:hypothetical protein|tara:strand:- start:1907 stop:2527 length:621 start_codon:yes stop_codon:yes gene_type:complete
MSVITLSYKVEGFIKIYDPNNGEIFVDKKNAINYETMSEAIADTLSSRGYGEIYEMAFGNGGASVSETGVITYLPPNVTGQNAALYNQTYAKIVDDTSVFNLDPTRNKMTVSHTTGKYYTDILVQCLLDYGEPAGQAAFDNSTQTDSSYIFDELGLLANYGTDSSGATITRLLTHVIFHPVQKSLNRQIQIDYTVRIQSLTNLVTI